MNTRIISMAILSFGFLIPFNSNAAESATSTVADIAELQHVVGPNKLMAGPYTQMSLFIDNYTANHYIRTKSPDSYTSNDLYAGPYEMMVTRPEVGNDSIFESYGMMLASLCLMTIIAHRKLSFEEE